MVQSTLAPKAIFRSIAMTLLLLFSVLPAAAAAKCDAGPFVISVGKTYDQAARSGSAAAFANGVARYSDMRSIAFFALGRYRSKLPKAREAEYVALTKSFMGQFMLDHGQSLRVGTLQIVECSGSGANINVKARTAGGDTVLFRISKTGSGFTVRDVRANSIWLVQQMRSAFVGTISRNDGDIDALFKYLKS
jgi:ABC-type transporter MlaC component